MKNTPLDQFEKAKNYCFLLLKFRLRSEKELYSRLEKKKFDETIIRKVLDFLKEKKFIDDLCFSRGWANSRIKKGFGIRRIAQELALKGIDKGLIESQISRIKEDYPQANLALEIARKRIDKMKGLEPEKKKMRIYGYLMRRGFAPDVVMDVLGQLGGLKQQ